MTTSRPKTLVDEALDLFHRIDSYEESQSEWGFVSSFSYVLIILSLYLVFVLIIGPRIMKNVPPLNVTTPMLLYNFVQIAFNVYLFFNVVKYLRIKLSEGSFQCINLEPRGSKYYNEVHFVMWMAVINKTLDLADTIFFVLRKKWTHLTFLHLYHHTLTFTGTWFLARFVPAGVIIVFGVMNTFVHTIMYSYYFMSACPYSCIKSYAKYLRKTVTQLQILQFALAGIHALWSLADETCTYPKELIIFGIVQDAIMIFLFSSFYIRTYLQPENEPELPLNPQIQEFSKFKMF